MANAKITDLAAATTPLTGTELVEIVQGGTNKKVTASAFGSAGSFLPLSGGTMTGNIVMGGTQKLTGLAAGSANGDSVRYEQIAGVYDVWVSAAAFWSRITSGCALLAQTEMTTSLFNIQSLDFDQTTQEFAQCQLVLARRYNLGTITAEVYWTAASGSGGVVWGLSGGAYRNDDALTVALGTAQTMTDTLTATNDLDITPTSAAITLAGTAAAANFIALQISRNPADVSDTLNADAKFLGVLLHITVTGAVDA